MNMRRRKREDCSAGGYLIKICHMYILSCQVHNFLRWEVQSSSPRLIVDCLLQVSERSNQRLSLHAEVGENQMKVKMNLLPCFNFN